MSFLDEFNGNVATVGAACDRPRCARLWAVTGVEEIGGERFPLLCKGINILDASTRSAD